MDRVRNQQIPKVGPTLDYLGMLSVFIAFPFLIVCTDEAFTSENWIVRIYQVRKEDPLGRDLKSANAFAEGKKRKRSKPVSKRRAIV